MVEHPCKEARTFGSHPYQDELTKERRGEREQNTGQRTRRKEESEVDKAGAKSRRTQEVNLRKREQVVEWAAAGTAEWELKTRGLWQVTFKKPFQ